MQNLKIFTLKEVLKKRKTRYFVMKCQSVKIKNLIQLFLAGVVDRINTTKQNKSREKLINNKNKIKIKKLKIKNKNKNKNKIKIKIKIKKIKNKK